MIVLDGQGRVILFNKNAHQISQKFMKNPIRDGDYIPDILLPKVRDAVSEIINGVKINKQAKSCIEFTNDSGTRIVLELDCCEVVNHEQDDANTYLFISDITRQKIFESKLTGLASSISNLIEKANAIIFGVDTRGYITEWNSYSCKITGFEKNEVYAQKLASTLLTQDERPLFDDMMKRLLDNESIERQELHVRTKEGQALILLLSGTPRKSVKEEIIGVTFVGHDITELMEYRNSLEKKISERTNELQRSLKVEQEAVELKTRFVSIASHEFRTPLSSIQFTTNYLKETFGKVRKEDFDRKIDEVQTLINHMRHLLDNVLNYGKSERGKIRLKVSKLKVADLVNKIAEEVGHSTQNTHAINLEYGNAPVEFMTDENLMRNILINLLTNAIKFSPGRNHVFLKLEGNDEQLTISVRDEGIGILEDEIKKIFDAFTRGVDVSSIDGTGLGLSIVKRTVELLNGTIQVISRLGEGSTFIIIIPRQSQ